MTSTRTQELQQELNALRARYNYTTNPPQLAPLQQALMAATAAAVIDINLRGKLIDAQAALDAAEVAHADYAAMKTRMAELEKDLDEARFQDRMRNIAKANTELREVDDAYRDACINAARAYRRLLDQQRRSQMVPGAKVEISDGLHVPFLMPQGWQGDMGMAMRGGLMPWEKSPQIYSATLDELFDARAA